MSCETCDGTSNPHVMGPASTGLVKLLFCIRGTTLVVRVLKREWLFPQWLVSVSYCPMCGRDLKGEDA